MSTEPKRHQEQEPAAPSAAGLRAVLTVRHTRGQVAPNDTAAERVVTVDVPLDVARALAAIALRLPPGGPTPGPGTRRVPVPGGSVEVTIDPDREG